MPVHPDAPAFPEQAEALLALRPFLDAAGNRCAVRWWDADPGAVRLACRRHKAAAIPEVHLDLKGADAGK